MAKVSVYQHGFSSGVWDRDILPRVDQEKARLVAETQTNFLCATTGKMFLRPGQEYLGTSASNVTAELREFVFGATDAALLEFTNGVLRFWVDDALVTRVSAGSTVTSGDFSASTGWTLASTAGQTTTVSGGLLNLTATGRGGLALAKQEVSTSDANVEHALRITIARGPVTFRCGSTEGGDEYIAETDLREGVHSLAFTPTGTSYWIQFQSDVNVLRTVESVEVESAGVLSLNTPWDAADHSLIRMAQSADVVFVAVNDKQQRRIERRSDTSWSIVKYNVDDGPFQSAPSAPVRIKPSVTEGNGTLTAEKAFFKSTNVGSLFRLFHTGQKVVSKLAGAGQYSDPIEVTGISALAETYPWDDRNWTYTVTGTWAGTLKVYRSFDGPDHGYSEYRNTSGASTIGFTGNVTDQANTDSDDNAIVWYRIGFAEGSYTSGEATITINYDGGGDYGICRVTAYTSATSVDMEVLSSFKGTTYTDEWLEGEWSDRRGWPSSVALAEGRLWWAGLDRIWGSISDAYESFDIDYEGDAGPISRSVATGGLNQMQWIVPLQRLIFGTDGNEISARSSSFDEPLTPTNTMLKSASTVGCAPIGPVRIDNRALFVDRSGSAIFEIGLRAEAGDYESSEISRLCAALFTAGVKKMAVQRRPDTRIWVVMDDGTAVCIVYEPGQDVMAFIPIETDGDYESVAVIPGATQDRVYFSVSRSINGTTSHYIEKLALDSESKPGTTCKVMDAFEVVTNGPASTTVSGLSHLIGETVVVWADSAPVTETNASGRTIAKEFTVSAGGTITLDTAATNIVVGLKYTGRYKSSRLAYGATGGTAILAKKRVNDIGFILADFARAGILYGSEFDNTDRPLYPLPPEVGLETATAVVTGTAADEDRFMFTGGYDTDSRVCIECASPFPASVLGLVFTVETNG